jgi:hypothetical protein
VQRNSFVCKFVFVKAVFFCVLCDCVCWLSGCVNAVLFCEFVFVLLAFWLCKGSVILCFVCLCCWPSGYVKTVFFVFCVFVFVGLMTV